jgi:phytoene desaturase
MQQRVIIIGAGIGGIATAILLARKGFGVAVYEKNPWPGGRCGRIVRDGHRFDLGATIFLMPETYRSVFREMGLELEECFDFKPVESLYHIHFDDGSVLDFTTDPKRMEQQLESLEPGSYRRMLSFIRLGYRFMELSGDQLLGRNFYKLFDFVNFKNIALLGRLKIHRTHHGLVRDYFRHPHLRMAFTFQNIYVGQTPFTAPALFSMLPAAELTEGSMFPSGGMSRIPEKLEEIAKSLGVLFRYGSSVKQILTGNGRARGILLEDGTEVEADLVVANADLPSVYSKLLPESRLSKRISRMKYACSAIVLHWGLDRTFDQLALHNVFLSDNYRECLDAIFKHQTLTDDPCFYIQAPCKADPAFAPAGEESISILIPVPSLGKQTDEEWEAMVSRARAGVINRLEKLGLENISDHIKFEICSTPKTWEEQYNVARGATFGSLSHSIFQMGYFRPHNRHPRYRNLYFAGGSTHPGNGIPLVLLSARLTTERILQEMTKPDQPNEPGDPPIS